MSYAIVGHCGALAVEFRSEIVICCARISFFLAEEPGLHEQSGEQQQGQSEIRVPRSKIQVV